MAFGLAHAMAGLAAAGGIAAWGVVCSGRAPACATVADCAAEGADSTVPPGSGHPAPTAAARGPSARFSAAGDDGDAAVSICVAPRDVAALNHRLCTML